jgi:capsular polysaccharide biosynthesis protein
MAYQLSQALRLILRDLRDRTANLIRKLPINSEKFGPVTGWHQTTQQWMANIEISKRSITTSYIEVFPKKVERVAKSQSLDGNEHKILDERTYGITSAFVCIIPNGRVIRKTVITPDDMILADLSQAPSLSNTQHLGIYYSLRLPKVKHLSGTAIVLRPSSGNYFHWMFESLAGLYMLEKSGFSLEDVDYCILQNCCSAYQRNTLISLGVPQSKIIKTVDHPHLKADFLIAPSLPFNPFLPDRGLGSTEWVCHFLRNKFLDSKQINFPPIFKKRIYISRGDAFKRKVINESELIEYLESVGFAIVDNLSTMSVTEQALLFSSASMVIAPHGAALANLVFCQPGTIVVELFSPNWIYPCYANLCYLMSHEYRYFIASSGSTGNRGENAFDTVTSLRKRRDAPLGIVRRYAADPLVINIPSFKKNIEGMILGTKRTPLSPNKEILA